MWQLDSTDQISFSFPGPTQLFIACSTNASNGKLIGAWERGYLSQELIIAFQQGHCTALTLLLLLCFCIALALLSYPTSPFLLSKVLKYCSSTVHVHVLLLKPQSLHGRKGVPCTTASWDVRHCVFTHAPSSKFKVHRITPDWNVTKKKKQIKFTLLKECLEVRMLQLSQGLSRQVTINIWACQGVICAMVTKGLHK